MNRAPNRKTQILTLLSVIAMLALTAVMLKDLFPLLREVATHTKDETAAVQYVDAHGMKGVPILVGLQALQTILAVIPSAAIQILTGLCYGIWWGTLINIAGCALGNSIVFLTMRQLKTITAPLSERMSRKKSWLNAEKLARMKHPEWAALALFLIPGIPNGVIPYLFANTHISLRRYLLALVAGSVPSTFLCTFMGERLSKGSYTTAAILAVCVAAIAGAALLFRKKIQEKLETAASRS